MNKKNVLRKQQVNSSFDLRNNKLPITSTIEKVYRKQNIN